MKKQKNPSAPLPQPAKIGDIIDLGAIDKATEPVQVVADIKTLDDIWQKAFTDGLSDPSDGAGVFLLPRGSSVRIDDFGKSPMLGLRCVRVTVLSGSFVGRVGWLAGNPREIDPMSEDTCAEVGELLALYGTPQTIMATSPEAIDDLIGALKRRSTEMLMQLFKKRRVIALADDRYAMVRAFSTTPRLRLNCAELEVVGIGRSVTRAWCLLTQRE